LLLLKILYFCSMSSLYKPVSIFFSAILFILSICRDNYEPLLITGPENTKSESISQNFSLTRPNLYIINRNGVKLITSVKNYPVQAFKPLTNGINLNNQFNDSRIRNVISEYHSLSKLIYINLTNGDIVFPFHYFW
jgi:hypothetical protein